MIGYFKARTLSLGFAIFSMFFGAGNVIFPLAVGQYAGDKNFFAILGLIVTAAVMPIAGLIAMLLFDGSYKQFFGRLGKVPGFLLAFFIITLLGPVGSTPRCIALAYTTVKNIFLPISPVLFSCLSCLIIFLCAVKKRHMLTLLGWVLTPLLLISLCMIILIGLFTPSQPQSVEHSSLSIFLHGLKEGYNTMDLLAAFFFSSTILNFLRLRESKEKAFNLALKGSVIGAFLLASVYIGFSYIASFHAGQLIVDSKDELLSAIILKIGGSYAGLLICATVALACLTTAIALISAFADFVHHEIFDKKISYELILLISLLITGCVATFKFTGISSFLGPVLEICYPGLILLTLLNIAYRLKQFKPVKIPVFAAFTLSGLLLVV